MSWGKLLQPDLVLGQPIVELHPDIILERGLQGMVLDVDETLVPMTLEMASAELEAWVNEVRSHVQLWLVSNNTSRTRIKTIAEALDLPYMSGARKPSRRKLRQASAAMGLPVEQVAMVGDRLFTDVLAGNRLGMYTILVEPMVDPDQINRKYPVRAFEVWISQRLGATLAELP